MSHKPLIGIVAKPALSHDMWHYMEVVDDLRLVLIQNGALVVSILPTDRKIEFKLDEEVDHQSLSTDAKTDLEDIISHLNGVVLEGGLVSNLYEEEIARICIEKDVPLLGICSGFNNLVRALGGSVHIDKSIFHNQFGARTAHEVELATDSTLYELFNSQKLIVNSIHTCIANENEIKSYRIAAKCPIDNTVEAIELPNKKFVMGIKWHPELMDSMIPIFKKFIAACKSTI